jgi:hypothetical protein
MTQDDKYRHLNTKQHFWSQVSFVHECNVQHDSAYNSILVLMCPTWLPYTSKLVHICLNMSAVLPLTAVNTSKSTFVFKYIRCVYKYQHVDVLEVIIKRSTYGIMIRYVDSLTRILKSCIIN